MIMISAKPISVNDCWKGRRYKTKEYKRYERTMLMLLPKISIPEGKLNLVLNFGFSSKGSDLDNPVKPFIDILQKKYGFNDNQIYRAEITKEIVKKGDEYVSFNVTKWDENDAST